MKARLLAIVGDDSHAAGTVAVVTCIRCGVENEFLEHSESPSCAACRKPIGGWRIRVWCNDCAGDGLGCFDGGSDIPEKWFASHAEAEAAGHRSCDGPPWSFEIIAPDDRRLA